MVFFGKVSEKLLAEADQGEQTAAGAVIFEVAFQVFSEFGNAGTQKSDLHFGRTGITFFTGILLDDFSFDGFVHFDIPFCIARPAATVPGQMETIPQNR
jgi:hypothetical protein